ncbi:hypothetical protein ACWEO9_01335 [Streptomyces albidoflavus]
MTADGKAYYYLADETGAKTNTYAYSPRGVTHTTHTTEKIPQPYLYAEGDPVTPSGLAWHSPIASAAKSLIRGAKPTPAFFVACYTYNSLTDDGPENGTPKEEDGDLLECANPFSRLQRS